MIRSRSQRRLTRSPRLRSPRPCSWSRTSPMRSSLSRSAPPSLSVDVELGTSPLRCGRVGAVEMAMRCVSMLLLAVCFV
ncbi:hypothetical protein BRADI_4g17026v3 [Brachypodium distachyon]|uniref:Uncharacterized protein n=1 Tax=Brachypodium distachyon TaxID=15368 RepID=A0A2K2CND3_BRADI|nr:hypothetical protein BRADI_4g17026v3 [Brachypodium distachyon]